MWRRPLVGKLYSLHIYKKCKEEPRETEVRGREGGKGGRGMGYFEAISGFCEVLTCIASRLRVRGVDERDADVVR